MGREGRKQNAVASQHQGCQQPPELDAAEERGPAGALILDLKPPEW